MWTVFWRCFLMLVCFAFCKGHTLGMFLDMLEPMFCMLQGILALSSKNDFRAMVLILWKVLHFARVWLCLDALANVVHFASVRVRFSLQDAKVWEVDCWIFLNEQHSTLAKCKSWPWWIFEGWFLLSFGVALAGAIWHVFHFARNTK